MTPALIIVAVPVAVAFVFTFALCVMAKRSDAQLRRLSPKGGRRDQA
jgi:hypothetical protein